MGRAVRLPLMHNHRKAARYLLGITGMLHSTQGGVGTKVVIRVISTQGCAIEGAGGLRINEKCELYVEWQGVQIGVVGKVVSRDAAGRMGLKFLYLDKDTKTRLDDLCDALHAQSLAPPRPEAQATELFVPDSEAEPQLVSTERPPSPTPSLSPRLARGRRRVPRYVSELPTRITDPVTGATWSANLVNLSMLGGCLEGPELPPLGQQCELESEWQGKPLRMRGHVVWRREGKRVGVEFMSFDDEAEGLLRQVCANLRLQPMESPTP
jgi:hypothetical protein